MATPGRTPLPSQAARLACPDAGVVASHGSGIGLGNTPSAFAHRTTDGATDAAYTNAGAQQWWEHSADHR
jgi:hypothetical protein